MKPTRITVPDELKADLPPTRFGKFLSATPVVMAVVATMLAGLASSELTRAKYDRPLGAQQQSKAGDQWSFFQAKRLRGAIQDNTADLLQTVASVGKFAPDELVSEVERLPDDSAHPRQPLLEKLRSASGQQALAILRSGELPPTQESAALSPALQEAEKGVENSISDAEMKPLLLRVSNQSIEDALKTAREQTQAFDDFTKPLNQIIDQAAAMLERSAAASVNAAPNAVSSSASSLLRAFTAARLHYAALRYEREARLNQAIANLYELQVRKSNLSAEHHHHRSQEFFFGMLAAQAGVIISTFALAARNRNLLWSLAAAAGLVAVIFAIYVYLYV